jgi:AcrR family transcriptional regulator
MARAAGAATTPRPRGRRRTGEADAREQIVAAASREFLAHGYDAASMRAIARRADVDPALVHHYFADKAELFAESVSVPIRPDQIIREVLRGPRDAIGVNLVTAALTAMESGKARERVISLIRTALGHDFAATMLRQFLVREVLRRIADELGVDDGELRATAMASQLVGLFLVRYGVRIEPLASASIPEVAARIGPAIQWHLTGYPQPLDPQPLDTHEATPE